MTTAQQRSIIYTFFHRAKENPDTHYKLKENNYIFFLDSDVTDDWYLKMIIFILFISTTTLKSRVIKNTKRIINGCADIRTLSSLVRERYRVEQEKRNSISSSAHGLFSVYVFLQSIFFPRRALKQTLDKISSTYSFSYLTERQKVC